MKKENISISLMALFIAMITIAVLSSLTIKFILDTQGNRVKLASAKVFLTKDMQDAIMSCLLRYNKISDCMTTKALANENIDNKTQWGDSWVVVNTTKNDKNSITLCYPLLHASMRERERSNVAKELDSYVKDYQGLEITNGVSSYISKVASKNFPLSVCMPHSFVLEYIIPH